MKRFLCVFAILMFGFSLAATAETDFVALEVINMIKDGAEGSYKGHTGLLRNPRVSGTMRVDKIAPHTAGGSIAVAGVAAAPAVVGSTATTTNTVTITAKDGAGTTIAAKRLMRVWMSTTSGGAPSTNNIVSVTLSGGAAIQTVVAAADYVYLTAATGIASAAIVGTAAGTNYVNVADGGYVTSAPIIFQ